MPRAARLSIQWKVCALVSPSSEAKVGLARNLRQRRIRIAGRQELPDDVLPTRAARRRCCTISCVVLLDVLRVVAQVEMPTGDRQHVDALDLLRVGAEPGGVRPAVAPDHADRRCASNRPGRSCRRRRTSTAGDGCGLRGVDVDPGVAHRGVAGRLAPLDQRVGEVHPLRRWTPGCCRRRTHRARRPSRDRRRCRSPAGRESGCRCGRSCSRRGSAGRPCRRTVPVDAQFGSNLASVAAAAMK